MAQRPPTWQQAAQRALVADLVRTQATLQARTEQLEAIFASRWYRLARLAWRLRRGLLFRKAGAPRMAGEASFARALDGEEEPAATVETEPRPVPSLSAGFEDDRPRLLLAGHSFAFCGEIAQRARLAGAAVREDRWQRHGTHDEAASVAALAWADVVHCEWCLGNAVWYSRNKRPGQRLVVRFHRMELETPYPADVDLERVDAVAFVAQHVLEGACERFGWDREDRRFQVVPNGIDAALLDRPKLPEADFTLGAIGYVPRLKRLDLALEVLERLRRRDDRYRLLVKGREPWEYTWMSGRQEERAFFEDLFQRLEQAPDLRGAVRFEPFADDVPAFLRQVGWILSTSEVEGHSVALAEGIASGAVPAILARPGATEQYEERWVHPDPGAAAEAILAVQARGAMATEREAARGFAARWDRGRLAPAWDRLLQLSGDGERAEPLART
jgi:glycosyltransferase involved in cell wall biosynthesis